MKRRGVGPKLAYTTLKAAHGQSPPKGATVRGLSCVGRGRSSSKGVLVRR